ncbi:MAG: methyltransferase [Chitinivibrionales bacterium]|nr:methyltransferase [Chitinivibrionales bacterium]
MPTYPTDVFLNQYAPLAPIHRFAQVRAHHTPHIMALWEAWEKECGHECETPFWGVIWPASIAIVRLLLNGTIQVRNKSVLDFGCGGAIPSIAACQAGAAQVEANDIDPVALYVAGKNAAANGVDPDFTAGNLLESTGVAADVILVADMFYERSKAGPTRSFLDAQRAKGVEVFLADGERAYAPREGFREIHRETVPVSFDVESVTQRLVRVVQMQ